MRRKDDSKREAIANAAIELITTNGFADTSMSKIAKAANVSPATIYVYFENKEDMLNQLYLMVKRELSEAMLAGYDDSLSVEAGFKLIWENSCRYMLAQPTRFAFSEQFANSPLVNRVSREEGAAYYQPAFSVFERGKREGIFKDIPLDLSIAFFYAPLMLLVKHHYNGDIVLDRDLQQTAFEITWDALTI
ncbi:MAG TPA: TetR/AcrR family transcriptional regulator [Anaerolineae bacterium]|nr:TetR/AcrR family transcriptional regulator [Anaerolineae bacterium]